MLVHVFLIDVSAYGTNRFFLEIIESQTSIKILTY